MTQSLGLIVISLLLTACGTWVGSPKKGDDGRRDGTSAFVSGRLFSEARLIMARSHKGDIVYERAGPSGHFSLELAKDKNWLVTMAGEGRYSPYDHLATLGLLGMSTLPLSSSSSDHINLGSLTLTNEQAITPFTEQALSSQLNVTVANARILGLTDSAAQRYSSPDIDGDGVLDFEQGLKDYALDFHVSYTAFNGEIKLTLADIKNQFLPDSATITYSETSCIFRLPKSYVPEFSSFKVAFDSPSKIHFRSGATQASVVTVPGQQTEVPYTSEQEYDNRFALHVLFKTPETPVSGTYTYQVGDKTFRFIHGFGRQSPSSRVRLLPFVKVTTKSDESLSSISWEWRLFNGRTWVLASQEQLELFVATGGAFSLYTKASDGSKGTGRILLNIPRTVSGSANLDDSNLITFSGMDAATIRAKSWSEFTHPGLSYLDKAGVMVQLSLF